MSVLGPTISSFLVSLAVLGVATWVRVVLGLLLRGNKYCRCGPAWRKLCSLLVPAELRLAAAYIEQGCLVACLASDPCCSILFFVGGVV